MKLFYRWLSALLCAAMLITALPAALGETQETAAPEEQPVIEELKEEEKPAEEPVKEPEPAAEKPAEAASVPVSEPVAQDAAQPADAPADADEPSDETAAVKSAGEVFADTAADASVEPAETEPAAAVQSSEPDAADVPSPEPLELSDFKYQQIGNSEAEDAEIRLPGEAAPVSKVEFWIFEKEWICDDTLKADEDYSVRDEKLLLSGAWLEKTEPGEYRLMIYRDELDYILPLIVKAAPQTEASAENPETTAADSGDAETQTADSTDAAPEAAPADESEGMPEMPIAEDIEIQAEALTAENSGEDPEEAVSEPLPAVDDPLAGLAETAELWLDPCNKTMQLQVSDGFAWKSSNSAIVSVDADGLAAAKSAGTAKLAAVAADSGETLAEIAVTVKKKPASIKLNKTSVTLGYDKTQLLGAQYQLKVTLSSGSASSIAYSSSSKTVATVDENGKITAVGRGTATITAKTYNGLKATCKVTVKSAPDSVSLNKAQLTLGAGDKYTLKATITKGTSSAVSYASDNEAVAQVNGSAVTAIAPGTARITASTFNGKTAVCAVTVLPAPDAVTLEKTMITLGLKESITLSPKAVREDGQATAASFSFKSSYSSRVSVNSVGKITGKRLGTATITVKTYNGKTVKCKVTVKKAPKLIKLNKTSVSLGYDTALALGTEYQLKAKLPSGTASVVRYSSSNKAIVKIMSGGRIVAAGVGTATVTARTFNGKKASCRVMVKKAPDSVTLNKEQLTIGAGDKYTLKASIPKNTVSGFTYGSDNEAIAQVNGSGVITAAAPGTAQITVSTFNGKTTACAVTVLPAPDGVELNKTSVVLGVGESITLEAKAVREDGQDTVSGFSYKSSYKSRASVNSAGKITGKAVGTATITVKTYNGKTAQCKVTVKKAPKSIKLNKTSVSLGYDAALALGTEYQLKATLPSGTASVVRYSSSNKAVVKMETGGRIVAVGVGTATVTARTFNGKKASCKVTVKKPPEQMQFKKAEYNIVTGALTTLGVTVNDGAYSGVEYSVDDPSVAMIESGKLKGVQEGDTIVRARSFNGFEATASVHILDASKGRLYGLKIGIDPGHQAKADYSTEAIAPGSSTRKAKVSSGAWGRVTRIAEYITNLQIGLQLREELESMGCTVYMTRETHDVNISNIQRAKLMNSKNVDVALRIHADSSTDTSKHGAAMYVRYTGTNKTASKNIAKVLLSKICLKTGAKNNGVHFTDSYTMNNWCTVPCVLMELGFISNSTEDKKLNSASYQKLMVEGIVEGICAYFER